MKLQTQIPFRKAENQIDYESRLLLLGSCFSDNIGGKLAYFKFRSLQNPFGILFHPVGIANLIERAVLGKRFMAEEVFFLNERWHCFAAHSDLSDSSKEKLLKNLNNGLQATLRQLEQASHIAITLGTAWVYRHEKDKAIVANCHKVPQQEFTRELLSVADIAESLERTIDRVRSVNASAQCIFTVSPVRHLKDGFVENQRSKAHLHAAVHQIMDKHTALNPHEGYFPGYELMMDELRDYRFYEPDMVHPNALAVDYIWERFKQVWISEKAYIDIDRIEAVQKGLEHRPFNTGSEQYKKFQKSLEGKIAYLQQLHPWMVFD